MSYTTQCPSCQTKFKVSDAHLALAGGMVRCGRCSHVFHAPSHFDAAGDTPAAPLAPQPSFVVILISLNKNKVKINLVFSSTSSSLIFTKLLLNFSIILSLPFSFCLLILQ
ncbi:MJ0042-type zinc finger domain-containing protein [Undibacterium luofuense]|uniref:MJ0042-type zinc finger domain-containing protein n=1 Tax=Undibacterium luofuense TaxID=2828733 RepID=UPI0030ECC171